MRLQPLKSRGRVLDGVRVYLSGALARAAEALGAEPTGRRAEGQVKGHMEATLFERGKRVTVRDGHNVCTLTGREFFLERAVAATLIPSRTEVRSDLLRYVGVGSGSLPEVAGVSALAAPLPWAGGEFLAPFNLPVWAEDGEFGSRTSLQLIREFAGGEISLGETVQVSEAGLFSDGDPDNDWAVGEAPTDLVTAGGRAPFFYRSFEPLMKTTSRSLRIVWTIRVI